MKYKVRLNKKIFEVEVENGNAILLDEYVALEAQPQAAAPVATAVAPVASAAPAAAPQVAGGANTVKSPLPGAVVDVKVSVGQTVKKGDVIAIIEAMKMENEINASKDGKVTNVFVSKGSKVEQGSPLMDIE